TIATSAYRGFNRWLFLVLFVFGIQFFLTQMETLFFLSAIGMTGSQVAAILVTGLTMATLTVSASLAAERMYTPKVSKALHFPQINMRGIMRPILILTFVIYPLIYFLFGYFIAWQNPDLRMYYTGSDELRALSSQFIYGFIGEGIYPFQILRAFLWLVFSLPVIAMMGVKPGRIVLFALANAMIPASMLLLPNAFMPASVALSHFYETATSNFLWGITLAILLGRRRNLLQERRPRSTLSIRYIKSSTRFPINFPYRAASASMPARWSLVSLLNGASSTFTTFFRVSRRHMPIAFPSSMRADV